MNFKILLTSTLLFVVFMFCGCSSTVTIGSHLLPNGNYREAYVVNLNIEELATKHTNDEIATIIDVTYNYLGNLVARTDALAKQYVLSSNNKYQGNHSVYGIEKSGQSVVTISAYVLYSNKTFYDDFMESIGDSTPEQEENQNQENKIIKGFLYNKVIFVDTTNPVADGDEILEIYKQIEQRLAFQGVDFKFGVEQLNLCYDYAINEDETIVNRWKSNADKVFVQEEQNTKTGQSYKMKHFVWQYNPDGDNRVLIYRYVINNYAWYVLAFCATFVFAMTILVGYFVKKKLAKSKAKNDDNQILCENENIVENVPKSTKNDNIVSNFDDITAKNDNYSQNASQIANKSESLNENDNKNENDENQN